MHNKTLPYLVDWKLTPENASERGYKYFDDFLYDKDTSAASLQEVLQLMRDYGYKLGTPKIKNDPFMYCGLYIPTKK